MRTRNCRPGGHATARLQNCALVTVENNSQQSSGLAARHHSRRHFRWLIRSAARIAIKAGHSRRAAFALRAEMPRPMADRRELRRPSGCRHSVRTVRCAASLVSKVGSFLAVLVFSSRLFAFRTSANRPFDTFHSPAGGDCCWTCSSHRPRRCRWRLREVFFVIGQFLIGSTGSHENPRERH